MKTYLQELDKRIKDLEKVKVNIEKLIDIEESLLHQHESKGYLTHEEVNAFIKTLDLEGKAIDVVNTIGQSLCDLNSVIKFKESVIKVKS